MQFFNDNFPWQNMFRYLFDLSLSSDQQELVQTVLDRIHGVIPYDILCGVFDTERCLLEKKGIPGINREEYNSQYRVICPPYCHQDKFNYPHRDFIQLRRIDFFKYQGSAFYTSFAQSLNMRYGLVCPEIGNRYILGLFRSSTVPAFSEKDEQILRLLNHAFNRLIELMEGKDLSRLSRSHADYIRIQFPGLSIREAEIAALLCHGNNMREIALMLYLSPRTVETHVFHLYRKLNVNSKQELKSRLSDNWRFYNKI